MTTAEELLRDLVAIPSVNPAYGGDGEGELANFIVDLISSWGLDVTQQEVFPGRKNVIARIDKPSSDSVLVEAHMDTVGVGGWKGGDPFSLQRKDSRLFGRGACDTKASLATFLLLLSRCAKRHADLTRGVVFAATVDEEDCQTGAFKLMDLKDELNIGAAITGEPTDRCLIYGHKGVGRYKVRFHGKAAHSSAPHRGESAIFAAGRCLCELEMLASELGARSVSSELERPTLNVGTISGGSGVNVVPDLCELTIDRRIALGEETHRAKMEIYSILESFPNSEVEVLLERGHAWTDRNDPFVRSLANSVIGGSGRKVLLTAPYLTNAVAYTGRGLPAVAFGPGSIEQAHSESEFIETGEVDWCLHVLSKFFLD